jgi:hypothetical protein
MAHGDSAVGLRRVLPYSDAKDKIAACVKENERHRHRCLQQNVSQQNQAPAQPQPEGQQPQQSAPQQPK